MDEYIKRKEAIAMACKGCNKEFSNEPCEPSDCHIQQGLFNIPVADVVEVVRCKDCQYAKNYERVDGLTGYYCQHPKSTFQYGTNWERLFEPIKEANDFCSYGERREGE